MVKTSLKENELKDGATIKEKCPQCGNEEMNYHTLQLRSADEGATVFYTCTSCGYEFPYQQLIGLCSHILQFVH